MHPMYRYRASLCVAVAVAVAINLSAAELMAKDQEQVPDRRNYLTKVARLFFGDADYHHIWPKLAFDWKIVVGSIIGFLGAAFGSVGGVGGGGIYVPMLTLIIGFDAKSATAISKCMIMGAAASTVYYNLRLRHPKLDIPLIDYDLAMLFQPMLMLGISIGVIFNVIFPDWLVTVLLIIIFLFTSTKAFLNGLETWKKETIMKAEAASILAGEEYAPLSEGPERPAPAAPAAVDREVSLMSNVQWKEVALLVMVWIAFLVIQLVKMHVATCSASFWILQALQIPIAVSVTVYEAVGLCKGRKNIKSIGGQRVKWELHRVLFYSAFGILAGVVGGLLGLGGGFVMGPLFIELGVPPQVASASSTFAMTFSSSMSVVQYYILKRFPVPYAAYLTSVAFVAAVVGQHVVRKVIAIMGRSSIIIFILASTIFISAVSLGGVGIADIVYNLNNHVYMGFDDLCSYS